MLTYMLWIMLTVSVPTHYTEMPLTPLIYFDGMEKCTDGLFRMPADEHLINPKWRYRSV